jgi:hypothetical protein
MVIRVEVAISGNHKNVAIAVRGKTSVALPVAALISIGRGVQGRFLLQGLRIIGHDPTVIIARATTYHMTQLSRPAVQVPSDNYGSGFSKLKYDIGNDDPYILRMMKAVNFARTLITLTGQLLFFTQGLGFELKKNKSTGFPWHVGPKALASKGSWTLAAQFGLRCVISIQEGSGAVWLMCQRICCQVLLYTSISTCSHTGCRAVVLQPSFRWKFVSQSRNLVKINVMAAGGSVHASPNG